jgi:hypothetical protein
MNAPADANASRGNICVVWGWVAAFVWSGWLVLAAVVTADYVSSARGGKAGKGRPAANTAPVGRPKMCGFVVNFATLIFASTARVQTPRGRPRRHFVSSLRVAR